jgi:hypothetical protein
MAALHGVKLPRPKPRLKDGKHPFYLLELFSKFSFPPWTRKSGKPPPSTVKIIHFTSLTRL